jgi:hypothetical protein
MNTKKILLYTGGALALGAVTYFVWSFFQKVEIPVGNTTVTLGGGKEKEEEEEEQATVVSQNTTASNNPFTAMLDTEFEPIKMPDTYGIFSDIKTFPLNSTSTRP